MDIAGYTVIELLKEGRSTLVYRAHDAKKDRDVVLKLLKPETQAGDDFVRLQHEYEVTRDLDLPGIIRSIALIPFQESWVLVQDGFRGKSLHDTLSAFHDHPKQFIDLAKRLTIILSRLHEHNLIHKDINPTNILISPSTGDVRLTDFGLASQLPNEISTIQSEQDLEGTLAFIAPEQTGRMNRHMDYRADYYALGITFYQALTGQLPFKSNDPLELVHAHLAIAPIAPHIADPTVPRPLSDIVMKLIEKEPEQRYQSSHGLLYDLNICMEQAQKNAFKPFALGKTDIPNRLQVGSTLYGRENELKQLLTLLDNTSNNESDFIFIAGYAGIGKTSLVGEFEKKVYQRQGYFLSGKYEQAQRHLPYSAIIKAFQGLMQHLLAENTTRLEHWKTSLSQALGINAYVLTSVIPEIELLIGSTPPPLDLGPTENDNRFQLTFRNFLGVFADSDKPIVLYLDDLQWADFASLQLLRRIILEWKTPNLTLIGSYRDNEIQATHPLSSLFDEVKSRNLHNKHLLLQPLLPEHIEALISDTLKTSHQRVAPLAKLVFEKTKGNPYFTIEFLKSLHKEHLLSFDVEQTRWIWDFNKIRQKHVTGNVADLILANMQRLPAPTQEAVKLASLIGHSFDLRTLSDLAEVSLVDMLNQLLPAVEIDLIFAQGNIYRYLHELKNSQGTHSNAPNFIFQFSHDKVEQAASEQFAEKLRVQTHLKLARLLLSQVAGEIEESTLLFPIVEHFNTSIPLIKSSEERIQLATLNLAAGKRAKTSTAYEQAGKYVQTALDLLPENGFESHPRLTIDLHIEHAEVAYLLNDLKAMEFSAQQAIDHATDVMDKIRAYGILLPAYNSQMKVDKSLEIARQACGLLNVKLPKKPYWWLVAYHLIKLKWMMRKQTPETIMALPESNDPVQAAILRLVMHAAFISFFAMPYMIPIIVQISINIVLKYGNSPYSAVMFAGYGLVVSGGLGDIKEGNKYAKLALSLPEKYNSREFLSKLYLILGGTVTHWKEPLSNTLPQLLIGYQVALETGDLEYAGLYAHVYCYGSYFASTDLNTLQSRIQKYSDVIRSLHQPRHLMNNELVHQVVCNLQGQGEDPTNISGAFFSPDQLHNDLTILDDYTTTFDYYYFMTYVSYLFGNLPKAIEHLKLAKSYADGAIGTVVIPPFTMIETLTLLANIHNMPLLKRCRVYIRIFINIRKLKSWAHFSPENQEHRYQLCKAELFRVHGRVGAAMRAFESAIRNAKEHGYVNDQGLACELAGKFYLEEHLDTFARAKIKEAYYAYKKWGATAKTEALADAYPELLQLTGVSLSENHQETIHYVNQTGNFVLDMNSAIKAAQTLSQEVTLSTLFHEMVRIIMENAGAERASVILSQGEDLMIRAKGESGGSEINVLEGLPLEEANDIATSIVQYVVRSKKNVLRQNATENDMFSTDPYIQAKRPKSILCLPILHQGNLLGILYLENNLVDAAFTSERLQLLPILISQAAISIDHALDREQISSDRDRIKTVMDSVGDALVAVNRSGEIILMNNTALAWTGLDSVPLDKPLTSILSVVDLTTGLALFDQNNLPGLLATNTARTYERVEIINSPVSRTALLSVSPIWSGKTEEQAQGAVFLLHDRSVERRLEEAKDNFISTASHELRTPLTAILWGLDAFTYDKQLQVSTAAEKHIRMIKERATHTEHIVEALLTASKLQSSTSIATVSKVDAGALLAPLIEAVRGKIEAKGVTLVSPVSKDPQWVLVNTDLLISTLSELIQNACRFTEQGKIELSMYSGQTHGNVDFRGQSLDVSDKLVIEIRDSGCGIDPTHQNSVFNSFFQEGGSMRRQEAKGGLGIGLYLARLRAEQMNAMLWFESTRGQGSSFYLALPKG